MEFKGRGGALLAIMISSFSQSVISQEPYPDFYLENEYLVKPFQGAELQIPVIEGEVVEIKCKVELGANLTYNIRWDYFGFNGTNSNTSITGHVGDEHAVSTVTLNIGKPAKIDEKKIGCMKANYKTIYLQFIVYTNDSNANACGQCNGREPIKLKRFGNKEILVPSLKKGFEEKLEEKLEQNYDNIHIDGTYICGCKKTATPSDTEEQKDQSYSGTPGAGGIVGGIVTIVAIVALASLCYKNGHEIEKWAKKQKKKFNGQNNAVEMTVEHNEAGKTLVSQEV